MKTNEDNLLKASCEIHVFWTITTAFVSEHTTKSWFLSVRFNARYDDVLPCRL